MFSQNLCFQNWSLQCNINPDQYKPSKESLVVFINIHQEAKLHSDDKYTKSPTYPWSDYLFYLFEQIVEQVCLKFPKFVWPSSKRR